MSNCFVINAAAHLQPSCSSLASENNPLISLDWWIDPQIWWESNKELSVGWFKEYLKEITMGNYQWVTTVSDVILPTSVLSCEFLLKPKKQDNAGAWATSTKYACRLGSGRYGSWNCVSKFDVMYLFVPVPMTTNGWPQKKKLRVLRGGGHSRTRFLVAQKQHAKKYEDWRVLSFTSWCTLYPMAQGDDGFTCDSDNTLCHNADRPHQTRPDHASSKEMLGPGTSLKFFA